MQKALFPKSGKRDLFLPTKLFQGFLKTEGIEIPNRNKGHNYPKRICQRRANGLSSLWPKSTSWGGPGYNSWLKTLNEPKNYFQSEPKPKKIIKMIDQSKIKSKTNDQEVRLIKKRSFWFKFITTSDKTLPGIFQE